MLETVGAWLRIWTPPRDAEVPPVPWRRLLVALAAVALAVAIAAPLIEEGKERGAEREARRAAALDATRKRRLAREQRAHRARAHRPAGDAAPARRPLIAALERSITRDARGRVARGELDGRILRTTCEPAAGAVRFGERRAYECVAVTGTFSGSIARGTTGYPFRAVVDFTDYSYVWCKTNPVPGEHVQGRPEQPGPGVLTHTYV